MKSGNSEDWIAEGNGYTVDQLIEILQTISRRGGGKVTVTAGIAHQTVPLKKLTFDETDDQKSFVRLTVL